MECTNTAFWEQQNQIHAQMHRCTDLSKRIRNTSVQWEVITVERVRSRKHFKAFMTPPEEVQRSIPLILSQALRTGYHAERLTTLLENVKTTPWGQHMVSPSLGWNLIDLFPSAETRTGGAQLCPFHPTPLQLMGNVGTPLLWQYLACTRVWC